MTTKNETFFVAYRDLDKDSMQAMVLTDKAVFEGLDKNWGGFEINEEDDLKQVPMKVMCYLVEKGAGSAPKKFENKGDGARRLFPLLPALVPATVVKAKIAKAKSTEAKAPKEPKTEKAEKQPGQPKEKGDPTGLRAVMDKKIKILVKENPKRPGTRAHAYFEVVRKYEGKTVAEFLDKARSEPAFKDKPNEVSQELRWNGIKKNFISFV